MREAEEHVGEKHDEPGEENAADAVHERVLRGSEGDRRVGEADGREQKAEAAPGPAPPGVGADDEIRRDHEASQDRRHVRLLQRAAAGVESRRDDRQDPETGNGPQPEQSVVVVRGPGRRSGKRRHRPTLPGCATKGTGIRPSIHPKRMRARALPPSTMVAVW